MVAKIDIFSYKQSVLAVKRNPWTTGKLAVIVNSGLAMPKSRYILAKLPPWYGVKGIDNLSKVMSSRQVEVLKKFQNVAKGEGVPLAQRIARIKEAFGKPVPTGGGPAGRRLVL